MSRLRVNTSLSPFTPPSRDSQGPAGHATFRPQIVETGPAEKRKPSRCLLFSVPDRALLGAHARLVIAVSDHQVLRMRRLVTMVCGSFLLLAPSIGCRRSAAAKAEHATTLLVVGSPMPDIEGVDQNGKSHHLSESKGRPTVVYFYPKDGTPGCTKEACAFRDVWQRFEQAGVSLYGVSRDDRESHERFAQTHHLPFPLIADTNGRWEVVFGVRDHAGMSARVSFLFDAQGKLTRVYPNVDPGVHAAQVLGDALGVKG